MNDLEKSEKLPLEWKYFNVSVVWIFYYRFILRALYYLKIPHEAVTGLSIVCGLASAVGFFRGKFLLAALLLHFKDVFDACDGALARLTGRGHLLGRYLDSLGDFVVLTSVVWAIALNASRGSTNGYYFWAVASMISIFIQCSFFNFYQLGYLEQYGVDRLSSRKDETARHDCDMAAASTAYGLTLRFLHGLYMIVYGWQDRLVAAVDRLLFGLNPIRNRTIWYGSKKSMTLISPLCFGTHIFIIIIFAIIGRPETSLKFISIAMNVYLLLYLLGKVALLAGRGDTGEN